MPDLSPASHKDREADWPARGAGGREGDAAPAQPRSPGAVSPFPAAHLVCHRG